MPAPPTEEITLPLAGGARVLALPDDAVAYLPANASPLPPLLVLLHGADHRPGWMIKQLAAQADARGIALLAPTSAGGTWDAVARAKALPSPDNVLSDRLARSYGGSRDADRIDGAIAALAAQIPVDRSRVVLAGFSDGATFALALGMQKRRPFSAVIAWSPGIAIAAEGPARERPVYVSHGHQDRVLEFATDCGEILPMLRREGARVTFLPFEGRHEMPAEAIDAFLDAAFGPPPGRSARPLPARLPSCHAAPAQFDAPRSMGG